MTIKIGGKEYPTRKPKNLDAILEEASGINAAETARMLAGHATPAILARALHPYLSEDAPTVHELAEAISSDPGASKAVRDLYASVEAAPESKGEANG